MTTDHYEKTWEEANKWLRENAPEAILACVDELAAVAAKQHDLILKLNAAYAEMLTFVEQRITDNPGKTP